MEEMEEKVDYEELIMGKMPDAVRNRIPIVTICLAGVSIIMALIMLCAFRSFDPPPETYLSFGANFRPLTLGGQLWRMFTSSFLHFGVKHLLLNMLCLVSIGIFLEKLVGHVNLFCTYFLTAFCSGVFSMSYHADSVCAGASGAVFGLFGANISYVLLVWKKYDISWSDLCGYMRSELIFVAVNFLYGLLPGIDMAAHVGGLVGGLALGFLLALPVRFESLPRAWFDRAVAVATALLACVMLVTVFTGRDASPFREELFFAKGIRCYNEKDFTEAANYFRKAAEQGYADAQLNLGVCYANGKGVEKDLEQAVYWCRKAADQGDAGAQFNLGLCYANGEGVPKDLEKAVYWLRKAAEQGHAEAQNSLGACYFNGDGVPKNLEQAVHWFRKAAEQGDAGAKEVLKALGK